DAFQATFLVLACKASSVRSAELVSSWLYGVAHRTALKARTTAARRRSREAMAPAREPPEPPTDLAQRARQLGIDQELARLPEKIRAPLLLCCLEGLGRDKAAEQLGWPASVVKSRLEQARELLRARLADRGLELPAGLLAPNWVGPSLSAV